MWLALRSSAGSPGWIVLAGKTTTRPPFVGPPALGTVKGTTRRHLTCEFRADQVGGDAMTTMRATALKVIAAMRLP